MAIEKMIGTLFLARDIAHREHLRTKSYAQHIALGEFYSSIIALADGFIEAYQGRYQVVYNFPIRESKVATPIVSALEGLLNEVEEYRYECVPKTDTALQNQIDEIVGQFLSTLYKLKNLK